LPSLRDNEWKDWLEYAEEDRREALDRFHMGNGEKHVITLNKLLKRYLKL